MTESEININIIEENLADLYKVEIENVERMLEETKQAKELNLLEKRIEELEEEIEQIKKFIAEDGLNKRIKILEEVLESLKNQEKLQKLTGKPTLVDFWAEWCAPCKFISPLINNFKEQYKDKLNVIKIDTESEVGAKIFIEYSKKTGVNAIPYFILFDKDGNCVEQLVGANPEKLKEMVENIILK